MESFIEERSERDYMMSMPGLILCVQSTDREVFALGLVGVGWNYYW